MDVRTCIYQDICDSCMALSVICLSPYIHICIYVSLFLVIFAEGPRNGTQQLGCCKMYKLLHILLAPIAKVVVPGQVFNAMQHTRTYYVDSIHTKFAFSAILNRN